MLCVFHYELLIRGLRCWGGRVGQDWLEVSLFLLLEMVCTTDKILLPMHLRVWSSWLREGVENLVLVVLLKGKYLLNQSLLG